MVADLGSVPTVVATGEGDIAWTRPDGYAYARLRDGSVHQLKGGSPEMADYVSQGLYPSAASRTKVFFTGGAGMLSWPVTAPAPSTRASCRRRATSGRPAAW